MAYSNILVGAGSRPAQPVVRRIGLSDLRDALVKGADDFYAMPTHAMFLCIIYPIVGLPWRGLHSATRSCRCFIQWPPALRLSVRSPPLASMS